MKRFIEIDVLKGFLIIIVVLGHSGFEYLRYIYWFHMPAFFIISGFLYKVPKQENLKLFSFKKSMVLLIPYVVFFVLVTVVSWALGYLVIDIKFFQQALFGGKMLVGVFGVFWFITSLLFTIIIYTFAVLFLKNKYVFFVFILVCYFIAIAESFLIHNLQISIYVPFNIDSSLIGVLYFYLGNLLRMNYTIFKQCVLGNKIVVLLGVITVIIILFVVFNDFKFDMKYQFYGGYFMDIYIPTLITLGAFSNSHYINKFNILF